MGNQTMSDRNPKVGMVKELIRSANLAWRLLLDPRISILAKLVPVGILLYVLSPLDLIPDWIIGFGQLDDLAIILLGVRAFIALCPPELVQWYRQQLGYDQPYTVDESNTVDGSYKVVDE